MKSPRFVKPADLFRMRRRKSIPMAPLTPTVSTSTFTSQQQQQVVITNTIIVAPSTPNKMLPTIPASSNNEEPVINSPHKRSPSKNLLHQTPSTIQLPTASMLIGGGGQLQQANMATISPRKSPKKSSLKSPVKSPVKSPSKSTANIRLFGGTTFPVASPSTQSPLKCLSNTISSPINKKMPTLLRNPFGSNQNSNSSTTSSSCCLTFRSPMKTPNKRKLDVDENRSPRKKSRMIELDEDANLEPPEARADTIVAASDCYPNDWSLRTKVRINFKPKCKNWTKDKTSTHRRISNNLMDSEKLSKNIELEKFIKASKNPSTNGNDDATKDATISVEAIKNVCTVYQHPYMAWMPLFPRITIDFKSSQEPPLNPAKQPQVANSLHKDWCDSLNDLISLLGEGLCPYFYMCADMYTILFKQFDFTSLDGDVEEEKKVSQVQAHISPCSYGLRSELKKLGIEFVTSNDTNEASSSQNCTVNSILEDLEPLGEDTPQIHDSGIASTENSNESPDENDETSQFLESLGLSQHDFPSLKAPNARKSMDEASKSSLNSIKNIATITGVENIIKLTDFLKGSRSYTITNVGGFACIPPTLLSPLQFRRSTPQHPEVVISKQVGEVTKKTTGVKSKLFQSKQESVANEYSPSFIELKGAILPGTYKELHALLNASNNLEHSCVTTPLDCTTTFKYL